MRRYAEDTIDDLLRRWGALGIQWTDEFDQDRATLQFIWPQGPNKYMARFSVKLPSKADLKEHAIDNRSGSVSENKLYKLMQARGKQEHRVLALWLKAAFNAIETGVVTAETLFLPFLVGKDGQTVAEVAIPRLTQLVTSDASKLLGGRS